MTNSSTYARLPKSYLGRNALAPVVLEFETPFAREDRHADIRRVRSRQRHTGSAAQQDETRRAEDRDRVRELQVEIGNVTRSGIRSAAGAP
jgi:hypothetical protein